MKERLKKFLRNLDKYSKSTPIVIVLGDRIAKWQGSASRLMIVPRSANFDLLFYAREPISFALETKDKFIAQVTVVPEDMMNDVWAEVYRRVKPMECELVWEGIFRKKAVFRPSKNLRALAKCIHGLRPDNTLSNMLISDPLIRDLMTKLRPGDLYISLKSMSEVDTYFISDKEMARNVEAAYYSNPQEITWYITYVTILVRGPRYREKILAVYDLMDRIALRIKEMCKRIADDVTSST